MVTKFLNQVGADLDVHPSSSGIFVCYPVVPIIEDLRDPVRAAQQRSLKHEMLTRMAETRDQEDMDGQRDMGDDEDDDEDEDDDDDDDNGDEYKDLDVHADSGFRPRRQV
ncbi:unnamed protein product [Linum trigynum]